MGQLFEEQMCMLLLMLVSVLISSHSIDFVFGKELGEVGRDPGGLGHCLEHLTLTADCGLRVGIAEGPRRSVFGLFPH